MNTLSIAPSDIAPADLHALSERLREPQTGQQLPALPTPLFDLLRSAVTNLASGTQVTLVTEQAEYTPAQAAKLLGVSRAYVSLLIKNEVFVTRMVGTHHRIPQQDVVAFQKKRAALAAFRELAID